MNNFQFIGPFKDYLNQFCEYKIKSEYNYFSSIYKLKEFDRYTYKHYKDAVEITKEILESYLDNKDVKRATKASIACTLRQFCKYLNKCDIKCYVLPERKYTRGNETYVPHIFTTEEIKAFFNTVKDFYPNNVYKNAVINSIFKLLYCTGMRVSECLNIKIKDIDFNNNTIKISDSKNNESRFVVINETLINELKIINDNYNQNCNNNEYFFRHGNGTKYNAKSIYTCFRNILYYSKIPHTGKGPRVHDFRHTFCVLSLKNAVEKGYDINNYFTILGTYIGHKRITSTAYYLRLTSEMYPSIRKQIEDYSNSLIRTMDGDYDD